eukprot:241976-Chlamydomonas_euryale.AAC.5
MRHHETYLCHPRAAALLCRSAVRVQAPGLRSCRSWSTLSTPSDAHCPVLEAGEQKPLSAVRG